MTLMIIPYLDLASVSTPNYSSLLIHKKFTATWIKPKFPLSLLLFLTNHFFRLWYYDMFSIFSFKVLLNTASCKKRTYLTFLLTRSILPNLSLSSFSWALLADIPAVSEYTWTFLMCAFCSSKIVLSKCVCSATNYIPNVYLQS